MAKITTRKFNPYEQEVRKKQAEIQKQSNALALQRIKEGNDASLAAFNARTALANQGRANAELAHRTGVSNLRSNTQDQALNMGNARGSWAGDYIAKSPERVALEQNRWFAEQAKDNELKQVKADRTLAAKEYARQLADYELERKRQAAQEYADTHYWYTPKKKVPTDPGPEPQYTIPMGDRDEYTDADFNKKHKAWEDAYYAYYGVKPT